MTGITTEATGLFALYEQLAAVRLQAIGRPIVNAVAAMESSAIRRFLRPLADVHRMNGASRAIAVFDWQIAAGLVPGFAQPDVNEMLPSLSFAGGSVADRAIFHKMGRLSLVVIRDSCAARLATAGLGQALLAAAQAERQYSDSSIVPVLAVLGTHDDDLARACDLGGVEYIPMGTAESFRILSKVTAAVLSLWPEDQKPAES